MKRLKGKHLRLLIAAIMYLELCLTGSFSQADLQSSLPADQLTGENETISINVKDIEIGDFFSAIAREEKLILSWAKTSQALFLSTSTMCLLPKPCTPSAGQMSINA